MNSSDIPCCKKPSEMSVPDPLGCNPSDLENCSILSLPPLRKCLCDAIKTLLPDDSAHHFKSGKFNLYIKGKYRSKQFGGHQNGSMFITDANYLLKQSIPIHDIMDGNLFDQILLYYFH